VPAENDAEQLRLEMEAKWALVDELRAPVARLGAKCKHEYSQTLETTLDYVTKSHKRIETKVDKPFGLGVVTFSVACDKYDSHVKKDTDEFQLLLHESQNSIKNLFVQLKASYERRSQLWDKFHEDSAALGERATLVLEQLQMDTERINASIEKKFKATNKCMKMSGTLKQAATIRKAAR